MWPEFVLLKTALNGVIGIGVLGPREAKLTTRLSSSKVMLYQMQQRFRTNRFQQLPKHEKTTFRQRGTS